MIMITTITPTPPTESSPEPEGVQEVDEAGEPSREDTPGLAQLPILPYPPPHIRVGTGPQHTIERPSAACTAAWEVG
jgi:hypothetical protein